VTEPIVERALRIGMQVALAAVAVQTVAHLGNVLAFDGDIDGLNVENDINLFAWASSMATFTAALASVLLAALLPALRLRLLVLGAILMFFSVDDLATIHERLGTFVRRDLLDLPSGYGRVAWPAIFLPLLAAAFLILWDLSRRLPTAGGPTLRLGLGLLVAAVAMEVFSAPFYIEGGSGSRGFGALEVVVEEGFELAAWVLIASALTGATLFALQLASARPEGASAP
jgi:hypothetical protein